MRLCGNKDHCIYLTPQKHKRKVVCMPRLFSILATYNSSLTLNMLAWPPSTGKKYTKTLPTTANALSIFSVDWMSLSSLSPAARAAKMSSHPTRNKFMVFHGLSPITTFRTVQNLCEIQRYDEINKR